MQHVDITHLKTHVCCSAERRMDHHDERWHIGASTLHSISYWRLHWLLTRSLRSLCLAATVCTPLVPCKLAMCCVAGALHHSVPDQPERLVNSSIVCCCGWYSGPVLCCADHDILIVKLMLLSCRTDMVLHSFTDGLETREVRWAADHGLRNPNPAATRSLLNCFGAPRCSVHARLSTH